jgi:hypothetical protein
LINNTLPRSRGIVATKAGTFIKKSEEHALQSVNPGGYYQAVWCRDASYILRDCALSGNFAGSLQELYLIWSHQIQPGREKLVYGRGSPEMKFVPQEVKDDQQKGLPERCLQRYTRPGSLKFTVRILMLILQH